MLATQTLPQSRPKTMAVDRRRASCRPGVTAKDLILAVIAQIGTGGGQGHVIEYRGSAIEELSMEGRMTICNMSIEAGARAGLIAPDETTFDYLQGRPHAPQGADWDAARRATGDAAHRRRRRLRPRGAHRRRGAHPVRHLGHQPGPGRCRSPAAVPDPADVADAAERGAAERALAYMGLTAGHPAARHHGRHRLPRLVHQRPDRGPAGRRRGAARPEGRRRRPDAGRPRLRGGQGRRPRHEGLDRGLHRRRRRVARRPAARCAWA